jgi:hypothetical protein
MVIKTMIFRLQLAREIHFPTGDVGMHVDAAGHDHQTVDINAGCVLG